MLFTLLDKNRKHETFLRVKNDLNLHYYSSYLFFFFTLFFDPNQLTDCNMTWRSARWKSFRKLSNMNSKQKTVNLFAKLLRFGFRYFCDKGKH